MDAKKTTMFIGIMALAGVCGAATAQDAGLKGTWQVTARATTVAPDASGAIVTAAGADSGLDVAVSDSTVPTLGFTYFVTDHVAVEAILGTSKHTIKAVGTGTNVEVHETWVLPPVITAQYHFNTGGKVSPYLGAGINYMSWYGGKDLNGFKVRLKSSLGTAVQAGANVKLKDNLVLNIDYKKVFYSTDAKINSGALSSDVTLDPSVVSIGLGYRF
ncbi:ompW family protein [Asticcacaulis biprosthecium C19]|uniref:OmpW family protein n=1 Tax=Asticcacaulis biprosthecium C19 TaxID=715226 RepID=F4QTA5_9CAUL|nr:ompW family protein [Asticcacaulis biprosthecium C19]